MTKLAEQLALLHKQQQQRQQQRGGGRENVAPQEQRRQVTELSELRQQLLALKSSALAQVDAQGGGWGWRVGEGRVGQ